MFCGPCLAPVEYVTLCLGKLIYFYLHGLSKKYPTIFFPSVSNGEKVEKLSTVVEGTFMHMCDFLLPHNTAR
jgi:hypothetical protein